MRSSCKNLSSVLMVRLLFLLWLAHLVFIFLKYILFILVLSSFWPVKASCMTRFFSSSCVLVLLMVSCVVCWMAVFMVACLRFIHPPYFSRTCSGVQPVFGRIISKVPVLNSRRGCLTLRYSTVYSVGLGIGFHAVN